MMQWKQMRDWEVISLASHNLEREVQSFKRRDSSPYRIVLLQICYYGHVKQSDWWHSGAIYCATSG